MDHSIHESYYLRLPSGPPTQADIWEGLPTWEEGEQVCTGILITPRCDFAHEKTPVVNYLPIIPIKRYLLQFGGFGLLEQEADRVRTSLSNAARGLGVSELLEIGLPHEVVCELIERGRVAPPQPTTANQRDKYFAEFRSCSERLDGITKLLQKRSLTESDLCTFINKRPIERLMRDLVRNVVSDTFFLPPCKPIIETPSLVLLRYIFTCNIGIFKPGAAGASPSGSNLSKSPDRLLRLKSPYVEALISRLAALFSRVGIRDLPPPIVNTFAQLG